MNPNQRPNLRFPPGAILLTILSLLLLTPGAKAAGAPATLFIQEYRVEGARHLPRLAVEEAVYPYLGPGRTQDDVEQARAALEKAYRAAGYQTVAVQIPPQRVTDGIVRLQVVEGVVARLRVKGSRYFAPDQVKAAAPSLAEGKVVNFNDVPRDIIALNQNPDRRVTPSLSAGAAPGSVDVDLNVKDSMPLHASVELNNRNSANTTALRLNASVTDNNLFQRGDSAGLSFQTAPERTRDAKVLSGYYLTRTNGGTTLMLQGTKQDSDVSTLGGVAVAGRGESAGVRAIFRLPGTKDFYHSATIGFDYKKFDQTLNVAGSKLVAPITYYPVTAGYSATLVTAHAVSEAGANVTLHVRGLGSNPAAFDARRYKADGSFIYLRIDAAQTRTLPHDWKLVGRTQAQVASGPLLDSEQFSGGGLGTVRGYLESEAVGDNALFGSLELQTPSIAPLVGARMNEWRFYVFTDGGLLGLDNPLPEQKSHFYLASYGFGTRLRFDEHFNGSLDAGIPQFRQIATKPNDLHLTFRLWAEF